MISFAKFLQEVRSGRSPYPWQVEFAERSARGETPEIVDVPTGAGKTTAVDALVWALARQASLPAQERSVGTRIVWAIDRRLLVDEVYEQAAVLSARLARAWEQGASDPLHDVARALQSLKVAPEVDPAEAIGPPLAVTRWRGGVDIEQPAHHVMQAEVITSTVGQIGSRLLFRGYGLGAGSLRLGAGLAACDATICLDEAHLAEPFAQTVEAIARHRDQESVAIAPRLSLIRLSATSRAADTDRDRTIELSVEDEDRLRRRIEAAKVAELIELEGSRDKDEEDALLAAIERHIDADARTVACVCSSVKTARSVFDRLERSLPAVGRMLLFGPQRPYDRERQFAERIVGEPDSDDSETESGPTMREVLFDRIRPARPLVVVATQAIEVGLDIDVDAMVTQSASAAALIQRFGRLNRAGGVGRVGHATVVRQPDFPLYDGDEPLAWEWLDSLPRDPEGRVDISVAAIRANPPPPPIRIPTAPTLNRSVLELFGCTSPRPAEMADPYPEPFWRGIGAEAQSDVAICWRSDLCPSDTTDGADVYREALLSLSPPLPEEQLTLSVAAARNLLRTLCREIHLKGAALRRQVLEGGDLEGGGPPEAQPSARSDSPTDEHEEFEGAPFLILRGKEVLHARPIGTKGIGKDGVSVRDIRAGDVLVVPTSLGGADSYGLAPAATRGTDVGPHLRGHDGAPVPVRLTQGALESAYSASGVITGSMQRRVEAQLQKVATFERQLRDGAVAGRDHAFRALIDEFPDHPAVDQIRVRIDEAGLPSARAVELRSITPESTRELAEGEEPSAAAGEVPLEGGGVPMQAIGWVLVPLDGLRGGAAPDAVRPADSEPPTLVDHCGRVAERVTQFAAAAGFDSSVVATMELAARAHDLGKADSRMQAFFNGGPPRILQDPLAKSYFGSSDRSADYRARSAAGLPSRWRHELASAEILASALNAEAVATTLDGQVDKELALHLVATHHGRGHPVPPGQAGGRASAIFHVDMLGISGTARGDNRDGWDAGELARRRARLSERYGHWSLAYLESILMVADRSVSSEGM